MKDQNAIHEEETKDQKWNRGLDLYIESVQKPDPALRGCAHNQKCYNELMEIREEVIDLVKNMNNPHFGKPLKAGDKNNLPPVKSINGISVVLLRGALGPSYMKDWSEEQVKEYQDWVSINT